MEENIELKPCPFCGSQEQIEYCEDMFSKSSDGHFSVSCGECMCTGPFGKTMQDAVNLWNRPTPHEAISEEAVKEIIDEHSEAVIVKPSSHIFAGIDVLKISSKDVAKAIVARFGKPSVEWPQKRLVREVTETRVLRRGSDKIEITDQNIYFNKEAEIYNQAIDDCVAAYRRAQGGKMKDEAEELKEQLFYIGYRVEYGTGNESVDFGALANWILTHYVRKAKPEGGMPSEQEIDKLLNEKDCFRVKYDYRPTMENFRWDLAKAIHQLMSGPQPGRKT